MAHDDIAARKHQLRAQVRAARRALNDHERAAASDTVIAQVWELLPRGDTPLASYLAMRDELALDALHLRWWSLGRPVWLPRVAAAGTLTWHPLRDPAHTVIGSFGIREPDPARVPAAPLPPDATVLVPGVAFTRDGRRLGQGQGFYDRVLADHRGHTIGIAFRCQMLDDLPTEPHDQRVAHVLSA
jgi:5-formyltetrahydrofolate cyclo-ligase